MKQQIKIAFAHNDNGPIDQEIGRGITRYVRSSKGRIQLIAWPDISPKSIAFLKQKGCQGIIASILSSAHADELKRFEIPIIAYSALQATGTFPFIRTDSEQVSKLAFEYLSSKQFKHFGYFGLTEAQWSIERLWHFSKQVTRSGSTFHVYQGKPINISYDVLSFAELWTDTALKQNQEDLIDWLHNLPKPIAILSSCDCLACHLSQVATEAGIAIPDDISILGIDNDESFCQICTPPLSSIALNRNKSGYESAMLLDKIITGKEAMNGQQIKIQPIEIKERASTDIFAVQDTEVKMALKYISNHKSEPIQVEEIAKHICISKRSLQMKFQQHLNTSIHDQIVNAHFNIARQLIIETNLPIKDVAIQSGFYYTSNMRRAFKERTGLLPLSFRQQNRQC